MSSASSQTVNLDAYFERIRYSGPAQVTTETLRNLHLAHATSVPFENLDVLLGKPIRLDLASLQAKLVANRRGGYCFEQNALFAAALESVGFTVKRLSARVRLATSVVLPRTHMLLLVEADGEPWVCDVGFGGWGLLEPIPLVAERDFSQGCWTFRLAREAGWWVLQCPQSNRGLDQYAFNLEPHLPVDYEPPNHYCSTYPASRFLQTLTAQLAALDTRKVLINRDFFTFGAAGAKQQKIETDEELLATLAREFGLDLPGGTVFRLTQGPATL